jgi:transposase
MGAAHSVPEVVHTLRAHGCTYRFIAREVGCSYSTISQQQKSPVGQKQMGRPKKITAEISSYIETLSLLDSCLTNIHIARLIHEKWPNVTLSEASVSIERNKLGFHWRSPLVKQEVSVPQQFQRFQFATDMRGENVDPARFIFSDESRFVLGDDHRWRHLRTGDWNETSFATRTKFPISVMIWGAIGVDYKSGCIFCSKGVDTDEYQSILKRSKFIEEMNTRFGPKEGEPLGPQHRWWFMQDGASCHTSKATMEFLHAHCRVLPGWPPNSPDLNPIEIIWAIMKLRVRQLAPKTQEELKQVILRVWDELDQTVLNRLILGFNKRLELVIKVHGRSISQYLSSHRNEPTAEDAAANPDFRPFGPEEDAAILHWVKRIGNRWKRIAEILGPLFVQRDRCTIKHRAKWLSERDANKDFDLRELQRLNQAASSEAIQRETASFNPDEFFQTITADRDRTPPFSVLE